jgi:hypothetical protein
MKLTIDAGPTRSKVARQVARQVAREVEGCRNVNA